MNVWNFTGNLGQAAETRFTPNGESAVSFSVAVKAGFGDKAATTWARCTLWGKRGESVAPYLIKGQQVGVSGEVTLREWTDKEGNKKQSLDVRVTDLTLLGKKDDKPRDTKPAQRPPQGSGIGDFEDDMPF